AYLRGDGYWTKHLESLGARVCPLQARHYGDPGAVFRLRRWMEHTPPDLVHAHLPPAELFARVALLGNNEVPFLITKHNDRPFYSGPGASFVGSWVAARACWVIAISHAVEQYTARDLGVPKGRLVT